MQNVQCPVCFTSLEVRDVTLCFVCGGAPESVARFDPKSEFTEFRLPSSEPIVLCRSCQIGEFLTPGGWGYQFFTHEKLPIDALQVVRVVSEPQIFSDKFCPECRLRLAFATLTAAHSEDEDQAF